MKTIRVVVIEDEPHIRTVLEYNLKMDGFNVQLATNGREGLDLVRKVKPDLVLCDWMMPEMNGLEVVEALKNDSALRRIPVFMLTAKSMVGDVEDAFKAGADDYLSKPFDPLKLAQIIRLKLEKFAGASK
jgi:CheY-like chemotaxis protein